MKGKRYSEEFKAEAIRQVVERGYPVADVAGRIGVSAYSLYKWVRASRPAGKEESELAEARLENQKLRAENRRDRPEPSVGCDIVRCNFL